MLSSPEPWDEEGEHGENLEAPHQHQEGEIVLCKGSCRLESAAGTIGAQAKAVAADGGNGDTDRLVEGHACKAQYQCAEGCQREVEEDESQHLGGDTAGDHIAVELHPVERIRVHLFFEHKHGALEEHHQP